MKTLLITTTTTTYHIQLLKLCDFIVCDIFVMVIAVHVLTGLQKNIIPWGEGGREGGKEGVGV